jgi:Fe-S-cluster-containing dehydrogenase component
MVACPFNVPRYEWDRPVPAVRKCDMCIDRLKEGKKPACAEACRYDATVAGTRSVSMKFTVLGRQWKKSCILRWKIMLLILSLGRVLQLVQSA